MPSFKVRGVIKGKGQVNFAYTQPVSDKLIEFRCIFIVVHRGELLRKVSIAET